MNNKTLALISYITLIGWLIAYIMGREKADTLLKYHLKQSLGLALLSIVLSIVLNAVGALIPALSFLSLVGLLLIILWIMGMINAANGALRPVPVVGRFFENKFSFIG